MRILSIILVLSALMGCNNDEFSYISVRNQTPAPIYVLPFASGYSDGDWIQPGLSDEFYSIGVDHLNGYEYFCLYYDSLIVYIKDQENDPVKFYSDGTTINYDPSLNPFTNPDMWTSRNYNEYGTGPEYSSSEEKVVNDDYFEIDANSITSFTKPAVSD